MRGSKLRNPANVGFGGIPKLPKCRKPLSSHQTGAGNGSAWRAERRVAPDRPHRALRDELRIDIDRDTNGAGLVYFANYITFLDRAEREAMRTNSRRAFTEADIDNRAVQHRRVAFYGNVATNDRVRTRVRLFDHERRPSEVAFHYEVRRAGDGELICVSEAVKSSQPRRGEPMHELWTYLKDKKYFFLAALAAVLVVALMLLFSGSGSPFIYSLF